MATEKLKKPCHDDPEHVTECYEDRVKKRLIIKKWCSIILQGGTWENCRHGGEWKEPAPPPFEGD